MEKNKNKAGMTEELPGKSAVHKIVPLSYLSTEELSYYLAGKCPKCKKSLKSDGSCEACRVVYQNC